MAEGEGDQNCSSMRKTKDVLARTKLAARIFLERAKRQTSTATCIVGEVGRSSVEVEGRNVVVLAGVKTVVGALRRSEVSDVSIESRHAWAHSDRAKSLTGPRLFVYQVSLFEHAVGDSIPDISSARVQKLQAGRFEPSQQLAECLVELDALFGVIHNLPPLPVRHVHLLQPSFSLFHLGIIFPLSQELGVLLLTVSSDAMSTALVNVRQSAPTTDPAERLLLPCPA